MSTDAEASTSRNGVDSTAPRSVTRATTRAAPTIPSTLSTEPVRVHGPQISASAIANSPPSGCLPKDSFT